MASKGIRTLVLAGVVCCGCGPGLEFAPWTIEIGDDVPVKQYGPVTERMRAGNRIELVEDLVISPRGADPAYSFFRLGSVAIDGDGNIYATDSGNKRVQVFDSEGSYLRTLGMEGQGPGELMLPTGLAVLGDRVVVFDVMNRRLGVWSTDGTHVGDFRLPQPSMLAEFLSPLRSEAFVTQSRVSTETSSRNVIASYSATGEELFRFADVPFIEPRVIGGRLSTAVFTPNPDFAAYPGGVYVADGIEYQVHAFAQDGARRWSLRVAVQRQPLTDEVRTHALRLLRQRFPDLESNDDEWPALLPAIEGVDVDGAGRVYVFPFDWRSLRYGPYGTIDPNATALPVDVYSPEGERLFVGTMPIWRWHAASGEFVYGFGEDAAGEETIVRYRLVAPY